MITRDDPAYEPARRALLWNRRETGRRPEAIVRAATDDDVVRALAFARAHGLRVAVRSGGHSWCGAPLRDGSLLIDLGTRDALRVDAATRTAIVEPAVTGERLAAALAGDGLAFPCGHCPSVALGGYVLAGGVGWNTRAWGMACDHLRALEVVLPDGRRRSATDDTDPDLLWAARGAGPGFCAVVTGFHLDLRPLPAPSRRAAARTRSPTRRASPPGARRSCRVCRPTSSSRCSSLAHPTVRATSAPSQRPRSATCRRARSRS